VEDIISTRYWLQVELETTAFAKGREETEDATDESNVVRENEDDGMDPYLDPLKSVYSEAQASQNTAASIPDDGNDTVSYTKLYLWLTLQRLVDTQTRLPDSPPFQRTFLGPHLDSVCCSCWCLHLHHLLALRFLEPLLWFLRLMTAKTFALAFTNIK
jgi:hypothetical protein